MLIQLASVEWKLYHFGSDPFGAFLKEAEMLVGFEEFGFERRTRRAMGIVGAERRQNVEQTALEHGADRHPPLVNSLHSVTHETQV